MQVSVVFLSPCHVGRRCTDDDHDGPASHRQEQEQQVDV